MVNRYWLGAVLTAVVGLGAVSLLSGAAPASWDRGPSRTLMVSGVALSTNATASTVKQTSGTLFEAIGYHVLNAPAFLEFFDVATNSSIVLGTTSPKYILPIVTSAAVAASGSILIWDPPQSMTFTSGIFATAVTTWNGATTASVNVSLRYQ